MMNLQHIYSTLTDGLLKGCLIGVGLLAYWELSQAHILTKESRGIYFHAPVPMIREDADLGFQDWTLKSKDREICSISREAQAYLVKRGQSIEITSINAPALLRAQREGK